MFIVHLRDLSHDYVIHNSHTDKALLFNALVDIGVGKAGSFTFSMTSTHPYYEDIALGKCIIDVYRNDEIIFSGIPTNISVSYDLIKTVECEGIMAQLNDSVQRFATYDDTAINILQALMDNHNATAPTLCPIYLAALQIPYSLASKHIKFVTNMTTTMDALSEIAKLCGGTFNVIKEGGAYYLIWKDGATVTNSQKVMLGKNIIDINVTSDLLDVANRIIPLGAFIEKQNESSSATRPKPGEEDTTTEETTEEEPSEPLIDERLTIKNVNSGKDYLLSSYYSPVNYVTKTIIYDDITDETALLNAGLDYMSRMAVENEYIEVTAFDLSYTTDEEPFSLYQKANVISILHDINDTLDITNLKIYIDRPENNTITLGINKQKTISERVK